MHEKRSMLNVTGSHVLPAIAVPVQRQLQDILNS